MVDWCDVDHGTSLALYDDLKFMLDTLHTVVDYSLVTISAISTGLQIILPGDFIVPIVVLGVNSVPQIPAKKFWGLGLGYEIGTISKKVVLKFPKQTLLSIWQSFVAPFDVIVPNSETWPYFDYDGEIRQGSLCTPPKSFGILAHAPVAMKWTFITLLIYKILDALGLVDMASNFISKMMLQRKYQAMINTVDSATVSLLKELEVTANLLNSEHAVIEDRVKKLQSMVGVRLRLS